MERRGKWKKGEETQNCEVVKQSTTFPLEMEHPRNKVQRQRKKEKMGEIVNRPKWGWLSLEKNKISIRISDNRGLY